MGPPAAAPVWFCRLVGRTGWKKLRAFNLSLRRNSQATPWKLLVPALEVTETWLPALLPYSLEKLCVWMRISCTASGGGKFMPVVWPNWVKFAPLKVKLLSTARPPFTDMVGPPRELAISCGAKTVVTPGRIPANPITLRPLSGRSWTRRSSTRAERVWLVVLTRSAWLVTVTSDCTAPTLISMSRRRIWPCVSVTPVCNCRSKPGLSALSW